MRLGIRDPKSRERGQTVRHAFTLLELSVVLAVIALIAGAGMTVASNALKAADRISTQEKLNVIKLALDSHAKTYGYLPCPAKRDITTSDSHFGLESRYDGATAWTLGATNTQCAYTGTPVGFTGISSSSGVLFGAVPVRSLGLPDSYAGDAWGNKYTYAVTTNLTADPHSWGTQAGQISLSYGDSSGTNHLMSVTRSSITYTNANSGGNASIGGFTLPANTLVHLKPTTSGGYSGSYWVKTNANPTLLTTDGPGTTTYLAYNGTDTGGTVEYQDTSTGTSSAYIVVSHGPNGMGAYPMNGTAVVKTCTSGTTDYENCRGSAAFYESDYNDDVGSTAFFDDYLVWGSNDGARKAVSDSLYTSTSTKNCPTGVCEAWCAVCDKNYPGAETAVPPTTTLSDATVARVLCRKVITSNSTDCKAACFWSGKGGSGFYKCP